MHPTKITAVIPLLDVGQGSFGHCLNSLAMKCVGCAAAFLGQSGPHVGISLGRLSWAGLLQTGSLVAPFVAVASSAHHLSGNEVEN